MSWIRRSANSPTWVSPGSATSVVASSIDHPRPVRRTLARPSAALYIDGKLVAAAEEERFVRDKHAKNRMPYEAAKFCLDFAGIKPADVDAVAIPFAPISLAEKARWHYAKRYWYAPDRGARRHLQRQPPLPPLPQAHRMVPAAARLRPEEGEIVPVEHHLTHASSAYHCSGFKEKTAILGIDGKGEYATTFFGYGENGRIHKIKEFYDPDSLGGLYGAITEYLGFEMLDGEYKVMGMAPYGDPTSTTSRAWRNSRTANWSSTPTTPT
jgi:carbamoyltransferase